MSIQKSKKWYSIPNAYITTGLGAFDNRIRLIKDYLNAVNLELRKHLTTYFMVFLQDMMKKYALIMIQMYLQLVLNPYLEVLMKGQVTIWRKFSSDVVYSSTTKVCMITCAQVSEWKFSFFLGKLLRVGQQECM